MERQELEKLTREYQMVQEQLQSLAMQREQFASQKEEQKEAMEQVEKATGKVFLAIGGAIVETTKAEALKNLKERQDSTELRLSLVGKQHDEFAKKERSMRDEITKALQGMQGAQGQA
jgi:prefoldin beta subunit